MLNKTLLGSAAVIMTMVGAQAADLPSKKAAPATYVKICDAYGAGFFFIPGTDTCLKVGGYVRVDYDYRPERKNTQTVAATTTSAVTGYTNSAYTAATPKSTDTITSGFYNRGTVQLDARTPTAMGVARTFMGLRLETGSGIQVKSASQPSVEAAFVQWAGFTAGQAAQPFAFMSSWAYQGNYWTGWPNGVRQLTYTAVLGGGFSATVGITDSKAYNTVSSGAKDASNLSTAVVEGVGTPGYNSIVYVGNVRYDQAWGSVQLMAAAHSGGDLTNVRTDVAQSSTTLLTTTADVPHKSGYAVGGGVAINLPMIAAGDRLEASFVYADRMANLIGEGSINNPSVGANGSSPVGGPAVNFANGKGWTLGAQFRHYFTSEVRAQLYSSYTSRQQDFVIGAFEAGKGNGYTVGGALVYSPAKDFDIGLELMYTRASWNAAAVNSANGTTLTVNNKWAGLPALAESNLGTRLRIQRNF